MQEISAKIIQQKIVESNIFISRDMEDKIDINMVCKVNLKMPKKREEKSVLLEVQLNISAKEILKIELKADVFFELEQVLNDYNEIAEKKLIPMACKALLNSLDNILIEMGYSKMQLADAVRMEQLGKF